MWAIGMDADTTGMGLIVNIPANMAAFFQDQDLAPRVFEETRNRGSCQTGPDYQIIYLQLLTPLRFHAVNRVNRPFFRTGRSDSK